MTKEEIKASIAANIAGQFDQVDISGKLAGILEGICDLIPGPYDLTGLGKLGEDPMEITKEMASTLMNTFTIKAEDTDGVIRTCSQIWSDSLESAIENNYQFDGGVVRMWGTVIFDGGALDLCNIFFMEKDGETYALYYFEL